MSVFTAAPCTVAKQEKQPRARQQVHAQSCGLSVPRGVTQPHEGKKHRVTVWHGEL